MYMLFKNKRPVGNVKFPSYEQCRQWARKLARKQGMFVAKDARGFVTDFDASSLYWRTPAIGDYGYSIRKV